jgi:anti-sigma-K factor RskA
MKERKNRDIHSKVDELCAMAVSGMATAEESEELARHLRSCADCRAIFQDYEVLVRDGIPMLALRYGQFPDSGSTVSERFRRIASKKFVLSGDWKKGSDAAPWFSVKNVAFAAVAVLVLAAFAVFLWTARSGDPRSGAALVDTRAFPVSSEPTSKEKQTLNSAVVELQSQLADLQAKYDRKQGEVNRLAEKLKISEHVVNNVNALKASVGEQLLSAIQQRDALNTELHNTEQTLGSLQAELVNLRAERENAVLRVSSLETKLNDIAAENRDRERRLKDAEQYLEADRDIREMMGARKLYIADLFDVNSHSVTQKAFGRVFYAQGKSLVFYAFDLEPPSGVKNASFQAWGQKEAAEGAHQQPPRSLGILYVDSESNHRWALSCEDPKELAGIDDVFVTVEPAGGSQKPTSKPLLYALLRKEVNHP